MSSFVIWLSAFAIGSTPSGELLLAVLDDPPECSWVDALVDCPRGAPCAFVCGAPGSAGVNVGGSVVDSTGRTWIKPSLEYKGSYGGLLWLNASSRTLPRSSPAFAPPCWRLARVPWASSSASVPGPLPI